MMHVDVPRMANTNNTNIYNRKCCGKTAPSNKGCQLIVCEISENERNENTRLIYHGLFCSVSSKVKASHWILLCI